MYFIISYIKEIISKIYRLRLEPTDKIIKPVTLFLDTEFTSLNQNAQLVSLAFLSESDHIFYAEFSDVDLNTLSDWHQEHVVSGLCFDEPQKNMQLDGRKIQMKGTSQEVTESLRIWLEQFNAVEVWCDCVTYDMVLLAELFGGALQLPDNVYYLPFDLVTFFKIKGIDPDTDRRAFSGLDPGPAHNALVDAEVTKACWQKLMGL